MRKTLWGYHVEETDDMIDSLQSQVELLTARVTNLNTELAEKNTRINEAELPPKDLAELETLRAESERLKEENRTLREMLAKTEEASLRDQSETERVGEICKQAYGDMEDMKHRVAEEMVSYIRLFNDYTTEKNLKLQQVVESLQEAKDRAHEMFLISAESILENYEVMERENEKFFGELEALNEQKQIAIQKIEKLLATFTETQEFSEEDEEENSLKAFAGAEHGKATRLARALSKSKKAEDDSTTSGAKGEKKFSAVTNGNTRVIGVNTHVKKNDIFGESTKSS